MTIKVRTHVNEYNNTHYFSYAEVLDKLPEVGYSYNNSLETIVGIYPASIDCENSDDVWKYDFYTVVTEYEDGDEKQQEEYLVAVKIEEEEE